LNISLFKGKFSDQSDWTTADEIITDDKNTEPVKDDFSIKGDLLKMVILTSNIT
jgi:hypothetical protein